MMKMIKAIPYFNTLHLLGKTRKMSKPPTFITASRLIEFPKPHFLLKVLKNCLLPVKQAPYVFSLPQKNFQHIHLCSLKVAGVGADLHLVLCDDF